MLLQTNSYIVPAERRAEHARLIRRFRQALARIGCDQFEVYEQVGANWSPGGANGRYVQIMRFRDRQHQQAVQAAERGDPGAQTIIAEFCDLINFPYQQQHGYFATGFYTSVLPVGPRQAIEYHQPEEEEPEISPEDEIAAEISAEEVAMMAEDAGPVDRESAFGNAPISVADAEEAAPDEAVVVAEAPVSPDEAGEWTASTSDDARADEAIESDATEPLPSLYTPSTEQVPLQPALEHAATEEAEPTDNADLFPPEPMGAGDDRLDSADLFPPGPFADEHAAASSAALEPIESAHEVSTGSEAVDAEPVHTPATHSITTDAPAPASESVLDELEAIDHGLIFEDDDAAHDSRAADDHALDDGTFGLDVPTPAADSEHQPVANTAPSNGHPDERLAPHAPNDDLLDQIPFPGEHEEATLGEMGSEPGMNGLDPSAEKEADLLEFEAMLRQIEEATSDHSRKV